jgi:hypothetical protein
MLIGHGVIVFGHNGPSMLREALEDLAAHSPDARKAWDVALPMIRQTTNESLAAVEGFGDAAALCHTWEDSTDVILLEEPRATRLGLAPSAHSYRPTGSRLELARFTALWSADSFSVVRSLAQDQTVLSGASRSMCWDDRFEKLAKWSRHVSVLDRYVGKNLPIGAGGELEWLLGRLDSTCPGCQVAVYTISDTQGFPNSSTLAQKLRRVANRALGAGGITEIWLTSAPRHAGRFSFPHDRHLRFDSSVFELSAGLDRLGHATVRDSFSCLYGWHPGHLRKARDNESAVALCSRGSTVRVWP